MGEDLGINLHTVRKAYNLLKDEGYLSIDRRKGAEVKKNFDHGLDEFSRYAKSELEYLIANAKNRGIEESHFLKLCSDFYGSFKGVIIDG